MIAGAQNAQNGNDDHAGGRFSKDAVIGLGLRKGRMRLSDGRSPRLSPSRVSLRNIPVRNPVAVVVSLAVETYSGTAIAGGVASAGPTDAKNTPPNSRVTKDACTSDLQKVCLPFARIIIEAEKPCCRWPAIFGR